LWATTAFVLAAIVWQAAESPSRVAGIVRTPSAATLPDRRQPYVDDPIETGSLPRIHRVDRARCTSLALDRDANRIVAGRCPDGGLTLRLEGESTREALPRVAGSDGR
jgi:hypothetical protein